MHTGITIGMLVSLALVLVAVVVLHVLRRQLRVRRVAGLFLWDASQSSPAARSRLSLRPGSLALDLLVAALLVFLANGMRLRTPAWTVEAEEWLNAVVRAAACIAVVVIAGFGWRATAPRSTGRTDAP